MNMEEGTEEPRLDKARHVKYWKRCLQTPLPYHYTSFDSNRMYLGYFTIAALDMLDSLTSVTTPQERQDYIDWVYSCQHPNGGFRMWRGTDFGERASESNAKWDPATMPATYFALVTLLILGDDFKRVQRRETLEWLRKLQRKDGSFGEILFDGRVEGGKDPRTGYCAAGVRYILRGDQHDGATAVGGHAVKDIDVDALVRCVRAAESYDGGFADEAFHEPHAGYTFCSLGSMHLVGRLNKGSTQARAGVEVITAPQDPQGVIHWLASRQTDSLDPDLIEDLDPMDSKARPAAAAVHPEISQHAHQSPDKSTMWASSSPLVPPSCVAAGMNGRINKPADTCYAFWAGASLIMMQQSHLCDKAALRRYLLGRTQHPVLGGFGKFPGDVADLYHSYLGLVAYALAGGEDVAEADAGMCISRRAAKRLPELWKARSEEAGG